MFIPGQCAAMLLPVIDIEQWPPAQQQDLPARALNGARPPGTRAASSATSEMPAKADRCIFIRYHTREARSKGRT